MTDEPSWLPPLRLDAVDEAESCRASAAADHRIATHLTKAQASFPGGDVLGHWVGFSPEDWPAPIVESLPSAAVAAGRLTRADVVDVAAEGDWALFATSFVWGYGPVGYGPKRLQRILDATARERIRATVKEARATLASTGAVAAYDLLRGSGTRATLKYWGPAFFTKMLYFSGKATGREAATAEHPPALILDSRLARAVSELSGMKHLAGNHRWTRYRYAAYLAWMVQTARRHDVPPDTLEYALFTLKR